MTGCLMHGAWAQLRSALEGGQGGSYSGSPHAFGIGCVAEFGWGCLKRKSQRRSSAVELTTAMSSYAHEKRKREQKKKTY